MARKIQITFIIILSLILIGEVFYMYGVLKGWEIPILITEEIIDTGVFD